MNASPPWPTNKYGTSWRYAGAFFDWRDEEIFDEAIETLDPLKITIRSRPVIIVGRPDLEAKCTEIEQQIGDEAWHFVLGLGRLDIANKVTHEALKMAFRDRWERFLIWSPHIEFWDV